jgi:hypothetical protein
LRTQRTVFEKLVVSELAVLRDALKGQVAEAVPLAEDGVQPAESAAPPPAEPVDPAVSPSPVFETPQSKTKSH